MKSQIIAVELKNLSHVPAEDINAEKSGNPSRVAFGTISAKTKNIAVARNGAPEGSTLFQRFMSFVTGFEKASPSPLAPCNYLPRTDRIDVGLHTFTGCSATLRLILGRDYVTPTITSARQLRCLCILLHAPSEFGISREALDVQTGAINSPDIVRILRTKKLNRFGKLIEQERRKVTSNGKTTWRGFYWMTDIGRLVAHDTLAKAGYMHDIFAAAQHMRRIEMDRQRLIAEFGIDHNAKAAVLDVSKPQRVRLINLLLWKRGWTSRYDIERLTDAQNPPGVVANINRCCGDQVIESETRQLRDRDGNVCNIGFYRIAPRWISKLDTALRSSAVMK